MKFTFSVHLQLRNYRRLVQVIAMLAICSRCILLTAAQEDGCTEPNNEKKACYKEYKVDMLLMFDQSSSMLGTIHKKFKDAFIIWIESLTEVQGVEAAQFAVLGCKDQEIFHNFTQGNFKTEVPDAMKKIDYLTETNDNLDLCTEKANNEIFTKEGGDREDARNIVLWISDCDFFEPNMGTTNDERWNNIRQRHMDAAKVLQQDKKATFFFICCKNVVADPTATLYNILRTDRGTPTPYDNVVEFLNMSGKSDIDQFIVLYDYNDEKLGKVAMDKFVPTIQVDIIHCLIQKNVTMVECAFNETTGRCGPKEIWFIVEHHPYPIQGMSSDKFGTSCPQNISEAVCDCQKPTPDNIVDNASPVVVKRNWFWQVMIVIAVLLVLIVVLILVILLVRRRRKINKQRAMDVKKDQKARGIRADLTTWRASDENSTMSPKKGASIRGSMAPQNCAATQDSMALKKGGRSSVTWQEEPKLRTTGDAGGNPRDKQKMRL